VRITADTNVLIRANMLDDPAQAAAAQHILAEAELIAVPLPVLCEFAWVLGQIYKLGRADVGRALETLVSGANVVVDELAVEAGLALLEAGGDFADGVIAHVGWTMGGETFVSFDKKAISRLKVQGRSVAIPG
jgi:predicted nucleic-acid-binding protein